MEYSQLTPLPADDRQTQEPVHLDQLARVDDIFDAYQHSRFGYVTAQAAALLQAAITAVRSADRDAQVRAYELMALSYQAAERGPPAALAPSQGPAVAEDQPDSSARTSKVG